MFQERGLVTMSTEISVGRGADCGQKRIGRFSRRAGEESIMGAIPSEAPPSQTATHEPRRPRRAAEAPHHLVIVHSGIRQVLQWR